MSCEALREALVAKLTILGVSPLCSFIIALRVVLVAILVIPGILSSKFFILVLYTSFLTTSFLTTSLSLLKSTEVTNLPKSSFPSNWINQLEDFLVYQYVIYLH